MALKLLVNYTVKPGCREEFLKAVGEVRPQVLAEEGCIQYEYCLSAAVEDRIVLVEEWVSREAQKIHLDQPHMAGIYAAEKQYIDKAELEFFDF